MTPKTKTKSNAREMGQQNHEIPPLIWLGDDLNTIIFKIYSMSDDASTKYKTIMLLSPENDLYAINYEIKLQ